MAPFARIEPGRVFLVGAGLLTRTLWALAHVPLGFHPEGLMTMRTTLPISASSPYNTFIHQGLPPGPIDSPGNAAIQAALHPDHGDLTYFVTVNIKTGLTKFTDSPTVFNQLVALCQKNRPKSNNEPEMGIPSTTTCFSGRCQPRGRTSSVATLSWSRYSLPSGLVYEIVRSIAVSA